ncbi:MAG TPA: helix-turn-helix transcriptional regulator, partial [Candidatus Limnocylindrales bacterium]|nr:helix-turn-helix transcriptional regulator [Candidatus Limnocylindrales bacterium]
MQDLHVGNAFRAVRLRRHRRQLDIAQDAGVSRSLISLIERGHLDRLPLAQLRRIASVLDIRVDVVPRWRGGELDRLINAGHSALHEEVARYLTELGGWELAPEVSFAIYGERGIIDILAWHAASRTLLVIELKTEVVDVQATLGTFDRKIRLASRIAAERGWRPETVAGWLIVAHSTTNRRRIAAHRTMLRAALPLDGRSMRGWLRQPAGPVRALSMWSVARPGSTGSSLAPAKRVGRRRGTAAERGKRPERGVPGPQRAREKAETGSKAT